MIDLPPVIERIETLLAENTEQSVTYAALEARLALEKVCYDRLRQAHDYISHAQLRAWTPGGVIKTLVADVGGHIADTLTLFISKGPAVPGVDPAEDDWVEVGTQIGFDARRITELWNALSGLALHVRLPKSKDDDIPDYGDRDRIRAKVEDALAELERLSKASMVFSGIGEAEGDRGRRLWAGAALPRPNLRHGRGFTQSTKGPKALRQCVGRGWTTEL